MCKPERVSGNIAISALDACRSHTRTDPVTRNGSRRLEVPETQLDPTAERIDRAVVVFLAGGHHDDPLLAIGNRPARSGALFTSSLLTQMAQGRAQGLEAVVKA